MRLPKATSLLTRLKHAALGFDAWVNASLYDSGRSTAETYERFQERMQIFSVRGWKRVALDLTSEAVTLGTGGAVLMLALAQPAFNLTSENWPEAAGSRRHLPRPLRRRRWGGAGSSTTIR